MWGGGALTETTLWTNSAPTSSFVEQTVTLSDSIENYKYIKFRYYLSTTLHSSREIIVPIDTLKLSASPAYGTSTPNIAASLTSESSVMYARRIYFVSNTSLQLATPVGINSTSTANNAAIPIEIIGMK